MEKKQTKKHIFKKYYYYLVKTSLHFPLHHKILFIAVHG